jgi:hypothetical protein
LTVKEGPTDGTIRADWYKTSPLFTDGEKALLKLTHKIGVDVNRVSNDLWNRVKTDDDESQIVEAVYVIDLDSFDHCLVLNYNLGNINFEVKMTETDMATINKENLNT